ncbi:MAG: DUF423 domain-containing protein [Rhizobiaceae bacterium]|nr:DUF423 domain-containing protein [Rhizobiaceae bacterium]
MSGGSRFHLAIAGLFGAAGVAASAVAAHGGDERAMGAVALVCLAHAPAMLAMAMRRQPMLLLIATALMFIGVVLFCGDLTLRSLYGVKLFPMAAPTGGTTLIIAWLVVAVSALRPTGR